MLDVNPAAAGVGRSWSIGAGRWEFFRFIIALFVGGMVFDARPIGHLAGGGWSAPRW